MGQFSWFTQDTNKRIVNGQRMHVVMTDNKGNQYHEDCYEGYGVFGNKDYYELVAEMNGYTEAHITDEKERKEALRNKGIDLAFNGSETTDRVIFPSLTESGEYFDGEEAEIDPDQGFPLGYYGDFDDDGYDGSTEY